MTRCCFALDVRSLIDDHNDPLFSDCATRNRLGTDTMAEGRASRTMSRRLGLSVVAEIAGSTWTQRSTGLLASQTRRYFRGPRYRCDHNFTVAGVDCPLSVWMSRNVTTYDFLAPGIAGNLFEAAERIEQSQYHRYLSGLSQECYPDCPRHQFENNLDCMISCRCGVHLHGPSIKAASGKVKYDAQDSHALSHSASRISYRQVKRVMHRYLPKTLLLSPPLALPTRSRF